MIALVGPAAGQAVLRESDWTKVVAPDETLFVYLPKGFKTGVEGGFFGGTGRSFPARVDSVVRLGHFIGGGAVIVEFYSGEAKKIQNFFDDVVGCNGKKEETVGGFTVRSFEGQNNGLKCRAVTARRKDSMFVVRAYSSDTSEVVAKAVVNSIRFVEQGSSRDAKGVIGSNVIIPRSITEAAAGDQPFPYEERDVDRPAFVLTAARAYVPFGFPRPKTGKEITVLAKVILGANGQATVVEVDKGMNTLHQSVRDAATRTIFIPAEKGGKAVSVYRTFRYTFF